MYNGNKFYPSNDARKIIGEIYAVIKNGTAEDIQSISDVQDLLHFCADDIIHSHSFKSSDFLSPEMF